MLIEDEADAVFNEIRNQERDGEKQQDSSKTVVIHDDVATATILSETKAVSPARMITIKVDVVSRGEEETEVEEPVSPPACHPDEGPPLLFSHCIEDLAAVIVKEKRQQEGLAECVEKKPVVSVSSKTVPALIPLTVSEFGHKPGTSSPSTLHMSGGGVYTTDSYFNVTSTAITSESLPSEQTSVIKKLPVSTPSKTVIKTNTSSTKDKEKNENILRQFYKNSCLISEGQKTIKLSDGLEITPIISLPAVQSAALPAQQTKKRSSESSENDCNEGSKRARNELVIEKIPRKNKRAEQQNIQNNEQVLDCKLVISRFDKKAKLLFENGLEVPISKNIFKHIVPAQSNRMRRKAAKIRKISNGVGDNNLDKQTKVVNDKEFLGSPLSEPERVDKDSARTEIPASSTESNSKIPPLIGQHKLPCIVSQPSYQRWANRKTLTKSK